MAKIIRSINIDEEIWEVAKELSNKKNRTISNLIETLIILESKKGGNK